MSQGVCPSCFSMCRRWPVSASNTATSARVGGREQQGRRVLRHLHRRARAQSFCGAQRPARHALVACEVEHPDLGAAVLVRAFAARCIGTYSRPSARWMAPTCWPPGRQCPALLGGAHAATTAARTPAARPRSRPRAPRRGTTGMRSRRCSARPARTPDRVSASKNGSDRRARGFVTLRVQRHRQQAAALADRRHAIRARRDHQHAARGVDLAEHRAVRGSSTPKDAAGVT